MNSASSKKSPSISVIIPSYNQLKGLQNTIKAFSSLRRRGLELIVVDGTSTDGSSEWIHSNASDIDQILIEHDTGIYDAMNKGLELANGDWVWFMGTGDLPVLEGVEEILEVVKGSTSVLEESDPKMLAFGVHLLAPREPECQSITTLFGIPNLFGETPYTIRELFIRESFLKAMPMI